MPLFIFTYCIISILVGFYYPIFLFITNVFISFYTLYKLRKMQAVFLLYFFLISYLLTYAAYYFFGLKLGSYTKYQYDKYYFDTLIVWNVFLYFFCVFIKGGNPKVKKLSSELVSKAIIRPKAFFFTFFLSLLIVLNLLLNSHNVIFSAADKYHQYLENLELIGGNAVLFFVLFCLSYYFGGYKQKSKYKYLLFFLMVLYSYLSMTRGTRMLFASMCFCYFVLYFENRFKLWVMTIFILLGFGVLSILNNLKHAESNENKAVIINGQGDIALVNNHSQILYGGISTFGGIEDKSIVWEDRLNLTIGLILETITPPTFIPEDYKYPAILHNRVDFGGGGLFIFVVYFAMGYVGVALIAILLALLINKLYFSTNNSRSFLLFGVIFLSLSSRWISYDFNLMYRLPTYGILLYLILNQITLRKYYENSH